VGRREDPKGGGVEGSERRRSSSSARRREEVRGEKGNFLNYEDLMARSQIKHQKNK